MSVIMLWLCMAILFMAMFALCLFMRRAQAKKQETTKTKEYKTAKSAAILIGAVTAMFGALIFIASLQAMNPMTAKLPMMLSHMPNTPFESRAPKDPSGAIIVYYRFECPDCARSYADIKYELRDVDDVYWLGTRSNGAELLERFPVESVPAVVYIHQNGNLHTTVYPHDFHENNIEWHKEGYCFHTEDIQELLALKERDSQ